MYQAPFYLQDRVYNLGDQERHIQNYLLFTTTNTTNNNNNNNTNNNNTNIDNSNINYNN